jgi:hypothetical protein
VFALAALVKFPTIETVVNQDAVIVDRTAPAIPQGMFA